MNQPVAGPDELLFLPLGGTGEVGMNVYLYGHADAWLMVDFGLTFADDRHPGVDLIMPDVSFIAAQKNRLQGLVITHAHEDHLGAVPYLWPRLGCPIYATPFACAVLRRKLLEFDMLADVPLVELPVGSQFTVAPFDLEFITVTHSVPEANALLIRTSAGTVVHSGDWKLDHHPLIGAQFDQERMARLGDEQVLALVGDSTNAMVPGHSGSELDVRNSLMELMGTLNNRVAVTCFATNVARVKSVVEVAKAHGRKCALVGRSMHNIVQAARETGYLHDLPPVVSEEEAAKLPRDKVVYLVTGSQGEARSALARISRNEHPQIELERDDAVIFSSRVIPGNEKPIHAVQNQLMQLGVDVLTEGDHFVHVSGHACQQELEQLYQWVRPRIAIPMHGEPRHLMAHARLAERCQVPQTLVPRDGQCIRLAPNGATVIAEVPVGRLALDGETLVPVEHGPVRERRKLAFQGAAVLTLVLDGDGRFEGDPLLTVHGLLTEDDFGEEIAERVLDSVTASVDKLKLRDRRNDAIVRETARLAVRRTLHRFTGRKPMTEVHLVRLG